MAAVHWLKDQYERTKDPNYLHEIIEKLEPLVDVEDNLREMTEAKESWEADAHEHESEADTLRERDADLEGQLQALTTENANLKAAAETEPKEEST